MLLEVIRNKNLKKFLLYRFKETLKCQIQNIFF